MQFVSDCVTSVACPETSQQYHLWGLDQKKVWSSTKSVKLNKIVDTIFGPLLMFHKFKYCPIIAHIHMSMTFGRNLHGVALKLHTHIHWSFEFL